MSVQQGVFSAKLCEMDEQYERFQARLMTCQQMEHEAIRRECGYMARECRESEYILAQSMKGCRSRAVRRLADIQLEYMKKADDILENDMAEDMSDIADRAERRAEASTLYAEFSMDFAVQAMRHAMRAALTAIDAQMDCDEKRSPQGGGNP